MEREIVHEFYHEGACILMLEEAYWYDTASPYKYCANRLFEISERIHKGQRIRVVSRGKEYLLQTADELEHWVKTEFNKPGASGFEACLYSRVLTSVDDPGHYERTSFKKGERLD